MTRLIYLIGLVSYTKPSFSVYASTCFKEFCVKRGEKTQRVKGRMGQRALARLGILLMLGSAAHAHATPQIVYRESFGYCTGSAGKLAADQTNWAGFVSGNLKERISNLKVFTYGLGDIGGAVNSDPRGLAQGYAFWWKPVYGLSVITSEFQFDVGILKTQGAVIEYQQRLSGVDPTSQPNRTRLALRIDDTWYISSESMQQIRPARWERVEIAPAALTYGTVPVVEGRGPLMPESFGVPLPVSGTVKSFGLFMTEVNGRVRFDNFIIRAEVPVESGIDRSVKEPSVAACPADSPDLIGGATQPTPAPDDDDSDTGVDYEIPEPLAPVPTPQATPGAGGAGSKTGPTGQGSVVYEFCPLQQQGVGRSVSLSSRTRSALMRKIKVNSFEDRTDRAIIAVLSQRPMPLGALVNARVGDYDPASGILTLATRSARYPSKLKLRKQARQALGTYLGSPDAPSELLAPLFAGPVQQGMAGRTERALCLAELRAVIKARAKQGKVSVRGLSSSR
jgi:hypothetical protein